MRRTVSRRRFPASAAPPFGPLEGPCRLWRSDAFSAPVLAGRGPERLRRFHEHYGDDVLDAARAGDPATAAARAERWLQVNPPWPGDPWHPYPTSTRVGNWIAAASLEPAVATPAVVEGMWRQLAHLALNVEDDILGNHVIRNARALVLGGLAFGSPALLAQGRRLLARELPEQVLPDGGHYERSPVYHLVVLRDLLELQAALPDSVAGATLDRMRAFAAALSRPDGWPALFNDGSLDLAPALELPAAPEGLSVFPDTGYAVVRAGSLWLAFDAGPPAPPFLPPHAHADALSFQLWHRNEPLVVDPGTSTYEAGPDRARERGTESHATVALDGLDQFALWGAFRSGPFPPVELLEAAPQRLRGRVRWRHGVTHTRTIEIDAGGVTVTDHLDGAGSHLVSSALPLASDAIVEPRGPLAAVEETASYAERFYESRPARSLRLRGRLELPATLGWRIVLPS